MQPLVYIFPKELWRTCCLSRDLQHAHWRLEMTDLTQAVTGRKYIVFQIQGTLIVAPATLVSCCSRRPGCKFSFLLMLLVFIFKFVSVVYWYRLIYFLLLFCSSKLFLVLVILCILEIWLCRHCGGGLGFHLGIMLVDL